MLHFQVALTSHVLHGRGHEVLDGVVVMCEVIRYEHKTLVYHSGTAAAGIVGADGVNCHPVVIPMS